MAFAGGIGRQYPPTGRAPTRTSERDDDREKDDNHHNQKGDVDHLDVHDDDHDGARVDHDDLSG
jgi:hypothetical protein